MSFINFIRSQPKIFTPVINQHYAYLKQAGFSYMGMLMLMVLMGLSMAGVGLVWHIQIQRQKEQQLLFVGSAIRNAIGSYYASSPNGLGEYPPTLKALLLDERKIKPKCHLRRLYQDPLGRQQDWVFITKNKRVIGVHSQSTLRPLKRFGFSKAYEDFSKAKTYQDWKFVYLPGVE